MPLHLDRKHSTHVRDVIMKFRFAGKLNYLLADLFLSVSFHLLGVIVQTVRLGVTFSFSLLFFSLLKPCIDLVYVLSPPK